MKYEHNPYGFKVPMNACSYENVEILEPYLLHAFENTAKYLLELEVDRLLAGFEEIAGLGTGTSRYPGWESTEIQGHTLGHYLAALSQAYVSSKNREFLHRVEEICRRLRMCQREDGYLFAWKEEIFDRVENHEPAWVPWYTFHKILSGLVMAYKLTGNKDAFQTAKKMGDWACGRVFSWPEAVRKEVLSVEYGGMNDILYELYKLTGDGKYFKGAHVFDEENLFQNLYENKDILNNLHANTTIPKILGAINRYVITGDTYYYAVAENFWDMVVGHHTYITGGNSEWEHFGQPDILDAERTACNCETCNVYNMLKLSKILYTCSGKKKYMDFYERAWMNAILSSQNPETGMTMYFQPMETGMFKVYQDPFSDFWCCTGTGMENFTKLQDALYFQKGDVLYLTRFISCKFRIPDWNMEIKMDVHFPETNSIKMYTEAENGKEHLMYLRVPEWTENQVKLFLDGQIQKVVMKDGYLICAIRGKQKIELNFYPKIKAHPLADNKQTVAFTYGPAVLCAGLGKQEMNITETGVQVKIPTKKIPVKDYLILEKDSPKEWLDNLEKHLVKKEEEDKICFVLKDTDEDRNLKFMPYFMQYQERYGIYWTLYKKDSEELAKKTGEQKEKKRIQDVAIDMVPIGNDQYELAHKIQGKCTEASRENGYNYRWVQGKGFFQYEIAVDPKGCRLAVTYGKYDAGCEFGLFIDGKLLVQEKLTEKKQELYTKFYELTEKILDGKNKVTVAFRTSSENSRCRIFQILYVCGIDKEKKEELR